MEGAEEAEEGWGAGWEEQEAEVGWGAESKGSCMYREKGGSQHNCGHGTGDLLWRSIQVRRCEGQTRRDAPCGVHASSHRIDRLRILDNWH